MVLSYKAYSAIIAIMVNGAKLSGKAALPGAAIAVTAACVYGMALIDAMAADDYT